MSRPPRLAKRKRSEQIKEANDIEKDDEDSVGMQSQIQNLRVKLESMEEFARKKSQRPKKAKLEPLDKSGRDDDIIDLTQDTLPSVKKERRKPFDHGEVIDLT